MVEEIKNGSPEISGRLFSVTQITLATFIGSPVAGCLLLAKNYRDLGKISAAWKTLGAGIISTVILLGLSYLLPENFPNAVLPIVYCIGMQQLAKYLQGMIIADQESKGKKGSWAITIGVEIGCLLLIFALIFATIMILIPE